MCRNIHICVLLHVNRVISIKVLKIVTSVIITIYALKLKSWVSQFLIIAFLFPFINAVICLKESMSTSDNHDQTVPERSGSAQFGQTCLFQFVNVIFFLQVQTFIRQEVLLSIKQDYDPQLADSQNKGVVAVVDNIQTDVSIMEVVLCFFCNKHLSKLDYDLLVKIQQHTVLTLLHTERPKLYGVLAIPSAIGFKGRFQSKQ